MTFDPRTHEVVARIVQEDGSYIDEIRERETPIELEYHHVYHDAAWKTARIKRDRLLAETDWVVSRSVETGEPIPEVWRAYRQALRDITTQQNPFFLTWPERPVNETSPRGHVSIETPQPEEL